MYVNVAANSVNIVGSVVLGLGLFGAPRLEVVGVGLATAGANVLTAALLCLAILGSWTDAEFARPRDLTIARQLLAVSAPRVAEGFGSEIAEFPFNALLLGFGEAVNAGFQIGRRVYQQVTGPLSRGYNVAASVLVGQALGEGDPGAARFNGWAVAGLGVLTVGGIGVALVAAAPRVVPAFTDDAATVRYAVAFARVYGVAGAALACFSALSGSLQGASETRVPLVARVSAMFGLFLGLSWLLGRTAGFGPPGAYVGVLAAYGWMALVVAVGFRYSGWASRAADMMDARGSAPDADRPDAEPLDGDRPDADRPEAEGPNADRPEGPNADRPETDRPDADRAEGDRA
jgi:Na+-driven multidrug efflux pump